MPVRTYLCKFWGLLEWLQKLEQFILIAVCTYWEKKATDKTDRQTDRPTHFQTFRCTIIGDAREKNYLAMGNKEQKTHTTVLEFSVDEVLLASSYLR